MREVQTHLERTARLTVAMTAVCVEESEKRKKCSPKGKSFSALHCQESSTCAVVPDGQHARRFAHHLRHPAQSATSSRCRASSPECDSGQPASSSAERRSKRLRIILPPLRPSEVCSLASASRCRTESRQAMGPEASLEA